MTEPLSRIRCCGWTRTGGRRTTSRSVRSIFTTIRCCAGRSSRDTSSRACSGTGARRPGRTSSMCTSTGSSAQYELQMIYVAGPGHGGPALVANTYLEGSYTERYPNITRDEEGMRKLFKQFSFPGGIPSHVAPETPGSIHEGGELGYSLSHAFGAVFDNPGLTVACVIGDGEAETGPLAAGWHSNKFLESRHRRSGAADPAPERLQDRKPDGARAHRQRGAVGISARLRLRAALRRGRRSGAHASADGGDAGHGVRGDPAHPGHRSLRKARASGRAGR